VTSAWAESTVTFNTAPSYDPTAVASLLISDTSNLQYRTWDIANLVQGWVNGTYPNYGLWVEEIPVQGTGIAYFNSSDSIETKRPILDINFTENAVVPEPTSLALVGIGAIGIGLARRRCVE
jgi:hypothetical protein